jgi:hypothetical protein
MASNMRPNDTADHVSLKKQGKKIEKNLFTLSMRATDTDSTPRPHVDHFLYFSFSSLFHAAFW